MTGSDDRRERIKAKVAASQARLNRDGDLAPAPHRLPNLPDAYPPDNYRTLAGEYPLLTVGLGLGMGLLAGALLPKRKSSGLLSKRTVALLSAAAEIAITASKQAGDRERDVFASVFGTAKPAATRAKRTADLAGRKAQGLALGATREAVRLVSRVRKGK